MKDDFSDIRFSDYARTLPYWIETYTSRSSATVWVKLTETGEAAREFYLYYGNGAATSESSGTNVFEFFDDFDGTSLDTSKWTDTSSTGTRTISNSIYHVLLSGKGNPTNNTITAKTDTNDATVITCARLRGTTQSAHDCGVRLGIKSSGTDVGAKLCLRPDKGPTYNIRPLNEQVAWGDILQTYSLSTWYIFEIRHDYSSKFYYRVTHSGSWYNMTMNPAGTHACIHFVTDYTPGTTIGDVDWIYQRKYTATEPTCTIVESGVNPASPIYPILKLLTTGEATETLTINGSYSVPSSSTKTLDGTYHIIGQQTHNIAGSYSVLVASTTQTLDGTYFLGSSGQADIDGTYHVLTTGDTGINGEYHVSCSTTKQVSGSYSVVLSPAATEVSGDYAVSITITKQASGSYSIISSSTKQVAGSYSVLTTGTKQIAGTYDIGGAGVALIPGTYTVVTTSTKTISGDYLVTTLHTTTIDGDYSVYSASTYTKTVDGQYSVITPVTKTVSGDYSVSLSSTKLILGQYKASTLYTKTIDGTYTVTPSYTPTISGTYSIISSTTTTLDGTYTIPSTYVTVTIDGTYSVRYRVYRSRITKTRAGYGSVSHIFQSYFKYLIG